MALPSSRNTTYTASDEIKSADLNDLQDWIANLYAGAHGERTLLLHSALGQEETAGAAGTPLYDNGSHWESEDSSSSIIVVPITLHVGDRIKELHVWVKGGDGGAPEKVSAHAVEENPTDGSASTIASSKSSSGSDYDTLSWTGLDYTVLDDRVYRLQVTMPVTSAVGEAEFLGAKVVYDRLAP